MPKNKAQKGNRNKAEKFLITWMYPKTAKYNDEHDQVEEEHMTRDHDGFWVSECNNSQSLAVWLLIFYSCHCHFAWWKSINNNKEKVRGLVGMKEFSMLLVTPSGICTRIVWWFLLNKVLQERPGRVRATTSFILTVSFIQFLSALIVSKIKDSSH